MAGRLEFLAAELALIGVIPRIFPTRFVCSSVSDVCIPGRDTGTAPEATPRGYDRVPCPGIGSDAERF